MHTFSRLVFTAVLAGILSGGFVTLAHYFGTSPIIARAEIYETAARKAEQMSAITGTHDHGGAVVGLDRQSVAADAMPGMDHGSATAAWEPGEGMERTFYTALADMVTAVAFALILVAAFELHGGDLDWRTGLFWGLAGFATCTLAPGLGLPPELPGTAVAPLHARQLWWVATAAATAGGLALLYLQRRPIRVLAGVALLFAPHLYGAPQPKHYESAAPEALAHEFVVFTTVTSLLFWIVLGSLSGFFFSLLSRRSSTATRTFDASALARRG